MSEPAENVVPLAPPKPSGPLRWNGREVRFEEYSVAAGREVRDAFEKDRELGGWMILQKSARYVDSGEPVFASVAEITSQPNRQYLRLVKLASRAIDEVAGFDQDDDDPPP